MKRTNGTNGSKKQPKFEKRVTTMPDGRYLIYYTFPDIDNGFERLKTSDKDQEDKPRTH